MDFELSPEHLELQSVVRKIAQEKIKPRARDLDRSGEYPEDIYRLFADNGLFACAVPEEYGGNGAGVLGLVLAIEEVAKYCNASALLLLLSRLPTSPIIIMGSDDQKKRYVETVATGERRGAFTLSEPQAGSDVAGQTTRAEPDGDGYRITGTKSWISGGTVADWYLVFARTDLDAGHDGFGAFIVEADDPGVSIGTIDKKMGVRGVPTCEVIYDGAWCAPENVVALGRDGFKNAMFALNSMRPIVAARGLGLAEGALMYATQYVEDRPAFGQTIADFQGIQWIIANLAAEIEACRLLTYRAALMVDAGRHDRSDIGHLSMAKYRATELAVRASGECLQLLGAAGYTEDHPLEQYYRDAKQLTIVEGTSQVQQNLIAKAVLDRNLWWD
jgi:alkylation response protein AidB-like acyl-CoA dehydrogenase